MCRVAAVRCLCCMVFRFELKYEQQGSGRWTRPGSGRGQSEDTRAAEVTLLQPSNTLTLRGSEWRVQYYEKVPALSTPHLEQLVWQFCSFNCLNFHDFGARQEYKLEILLYLSKMSS